MIRIQRRRTPGWRMPEGAIYVGRPTVWGNPFTFYADSYIGQRQRRPASEAVELFRQYAVECGRFWLQPLIGHDLVCWCPLDQPCHADVLLELLNGGAAVCPECDGDGWVVETEETCCGDVLPSGECCAAIYGTARVRFEQVQQPCPGPGPHGAAMS